MRNVKECDPLKLAEYSHQIQISQEPAFSWWAPHVIKKRNRIISKLNYKNWTGTHKYEVKITKSVKEEIAIDK